MSPKVSIILTSYNRPHLLKKAIESVLIQTMNKWELFIMDDASNKETTEIIRSYLNDKRIHYINSGVQDEDRHKTTRYASLINQAIPLTKGEYLSYLTDDTVYLPNRLQIMTSYLDKHPSIDIVYSSQKVQILNDQLKSVAERKRNASRILSKAANVVDHCSVMHTRRIAEKVYKKYYSYWDDSPECWHNGDAVFWMRLNQFQSFYPIPHVLDQTVKTPQCFQLLNRFLPNDVPNGTLVKGLTSEIYVIDQKKRRKITSEMLILLKYDSSKIVDVTDPLLFKYPLGPEIDQSALSNHNLFPNQRLIKCTKTNQLYFLENNQKRLIEPKAFKRFGFKLTEIITMNPELLALFENGLPIEVVFKPNCICPDNFLFTIGSTYYLSMDNQLHQIDINIIKRLKLTLNKVIQLSSNEVKHFKKGTPIKWGFRK